MAIPTPATFTAAIGAADYIQTSGNFENIPDDLVRKHWQDGVRFGEMAADPYMTLEGDELGAIIQTEKAPMAGKGSIVIFKTMMEFAKQGRLGGGLFLSVGSFENPRINGFQCRCDLVRHAYSDDDRMEEIAGMRNELSTRANELAGRWHGRKKTCMTDMTMLLKATGANTGFASGKSFTTLTSSHTISTEDFVIEKNTLKRYVQPAEIRRKGKNAVKNYLFMCPSEGLSDLELELMNSPQWNQAQERGDGNTIFAGGWLDMRGQTIMERESITAAMMGPLGSALCPMAMLGVAITAGTATFNMKGNWNSVWAAEEETQPFRWFPGHSYVFSGLAGDVFNPASGSLDSNTWATRPRYVKVIHPTTRKWGIYTFNNSHDGEALVIASRLAAATSGIAATTVGSVTWDADVNEDDFPEGSLIVPCLADGTTYQANLELGAGSLMRVYGGPKLGIERETERFNGLVNRAFSKQIFGQAPTYDVAGRMVGYRVLISAARFPDWEIR